MSEKLIVGSCPKCRAPQVKGAKYCVCGHKWGLFDIENFLKEAGIGSLDDFGFGDYFNKKREKGE